MSDSVLYDVSAGVATITLNRPEAMNSLDTATKVALRDTVRAAAEDEAVRVVVLTGTGRAFCVGQDLKEHIGLLQANDADALWNTVPDHYAPIALALAEMPKPVIASVNGVAAGAGASMAFACDFRVVADTAGFNLAFTGIALSCDTGISWTLPRLIGQAKATELLYFPRTIPADEALTLGLATSVVPADQLVAARSESCGRPDHRLRLGAPVARVLRDAHAGRVAGIRGRQDAPDGRHRGPPQRGRLLRRQGKANLPRQVAPRRWPPRRPSGGGVTGRCSRRGGR
jgi:2-(1,2-epoxy-1,2-dihydrophenyl)acetyl-CoA isomerase